MNRVLDPHCRYTVFKEKPGGKVPCFALRGTNVGELNRNLYATEAEITGLAFQKVDTGLVKPVLDQDQFSRVDWPNSPTQIRNHQFRYMDLGNQAPARIPPEWLEFTTFMHSLKDVMLNKLRQPEARGGAAPESLYEGILANNWKGEEDGLSSANKQDRFEEIQTSMENANTWTQNEVLEDWAAFVIDGMYGAPQMFYKLFEMLFTNFRHRNPESRRTLECAPPETSTNDCVGSSVPHCLVYGFHKEQVRGRPKTRSHEAVDMNSTNLNKRVLMPKRMGHEQRSRSASPITDYDIPLEHNVVNVACPYANPTIPDMIDHPDHYELIPSVFHRFFESHKPDLTLVTWSKPKADVNWTAVATIAIDISSYWKYGGSTLHDLVRNTTEQLVQSCLASLAHDQKVIHGLAVMIDGFKLVKIEKTPVQANDDEFFYNITESDLISWDRDNEMLALLDTIQNVL